jgi:hypothetical protein
MPQALLMVAIEFDVYRTLFSLSKRSCFHARLCIVSIVLGSCWKLICELLKLNKAKNKNCMKYYF